MYGADWFGIIVDVYFIVVFGIVDEYVVDWVDAAALCGEDR